MRHGKDRFWKGEKEGSVKGEGEGECECGGVRGGGEVHRGVVISCVKRVVLSLFVLLSLVVAAALLYCLIAPLPLILTYSHPPLISSLSFLPPTFLLPSFLPFTAASFTTVNF